MRWKASVGATMAGAHWGRGAATGLWARSSQAPQGCEGQDQPGQTLALLGGGPACMERGDRGSSSPDSQRVLAPSLLPCMWPFPHSKRVGLFACFVGRSQAPTCNMFPNTWPVITEEFVFCLN